MKFDVNRFMDGINGGKQPKGIRWGDVANLWLAPPGDPNRPTRHTFVSTQVFPENTPMAFALRFGTFNPTTGISTDPQPFVPTTQGPIRVTLRRSIDERSVPIDDVIELNGGDVMPVCETLCRQLTISVEYPFDPLVPAKTAALTVEVVAAPVNSIDCESISGRQGWADTSENSGVGVSINNVLSSQILLEANPLRQQMFLVNTSPTSSVAIGFNIPPIWTAGIPTQGTIVLPPGQMATYESPLGGFTGRVYARTNTGTATVLVTEGVLPAG